MAAQQRRFKHAPEQIRASLSYDPRTGLLTWLPRPDARRPGNEVRFAGKTAGGFDGRYIGVSVDGVKYRAHQLAWCVYYGVWPSGVIDHINGDGADNRLSNLRDVSPEVNQNNLTKPPISKSGIRGVCAHSGKWTARYRNQYLGFFATADAAAAAYEKAKSARMRELAEHP